MKKVKHERLKKNRRQFQNRCLRLKKKCLAIGLDLHWSKVKGEPRLTTKFSIWKKGDTETPLVKDLLIGDIKANIERLAGLIVFL